MNITGEIKGIKYKKEIKNILPKLSFSSFDINSASSRAIIIFGQNSFAISKWVSPKRTRSYPYGRIYDTIHISKKITVIPAIKDEGISGDRDFLQWDTISLMSLLDIYVVFAYYSQAKKKKTKITGQKFDNKYVISKIQEIMRYHSSALHWNLNELKTNLPSVIDKIKDSYLKIEKSQKVKMHNFQGIDLFKNKIGRDINDFMNFSRQKAIEAQKREVVTIQPKENLSTSSKAKITIKNYLGGLYYFTVDEITIKNKTLELIESKYSKNSTLPSKEDIKDGLLKMILYSNLENVKINGVSIRSKAVLKLTANNFQGQISSENKKEKMFNILNTNSFSVKQIGFIEKLFKEAKENNFIVRIEGVKC